MLTKTRILVLRCTPYGDHAIVARFFTRELGAYSYMLHGIRSKKSRITPAMLHPMALMEAEVYHRPDSDLQRVSEMQTLPYGRGGYGTAEQLLGSGLIAEILAQAVHDHDPQPDLFDWLVDRMEALMGSGTTAELVCAVLTDLSGWLGFSVDATTYQPGSRLCFADGVFIIPELLPHNAVATVHQIGNDPNRVSTYERGGLGSKQDYADPQSSFEMAFYLSNNAWPDHFRCTEAYLQAVYGLYARQLPSFRIPRSHPMFCSLVLK